MVTTHMANVLDTVRSFLDTCPDLDGADIQFGPERHFPDFPGKRFARGMLVTIDGHEYSIEISPVL